MHNRRITALILAFLLTMPALASCGETETADTETAADTAAAETNAETEDTALKSSLPDDLDFGGASVTIHARGDDDTWMEIQTDEATGEALNDSIFNRNLYVELPRNALRNGLLAAEETAFISLLTFNFLIGLVGNNAVMTGAFSRVPDELFESAELDGAGYWRTCFTIAIPCVWSTITMNYIFMLTGIFTADCNAWLYSNGTGEPGLATMGFQLFYLTYEIAESGGTEADYGYPSALGFVLTMMTLPVVLIGRKVLEKIQDAVEV